MSFLGRLFKSDDDNGEKAQASTRPAKPAAPAEIRQTASQPVELKSIEQFPANAELLTDGVVPEKYRGFAALFRRGTQGQHFYFLVLASFDAPETRKAAMEIRTRLADRHNQTVSKVIKADQAMLKAILAKFQKAEAKADQPDLVRDKTAAVRYFEDVMAAAIKAGATDAHFEARKGEETVVRFRINGVMEKWKAVDYQDALDAVGAAYTTLATENSRSEPTFNAGLMQSCSIELPQPNGMLYRIRYQSSPTLGGFDVVLRLLKIELTNSGGKEPSLTALGYSEYHAHVMDLARRKNDGAIILAGVTGSGKSTTLKTLMTMGGSHRAKRKQWSIEDPVEYKMFGVSQVSVQRTAKGDGSEVNPFTASVRMVLRADPDTVMVGEIRDKETGSLCKSMVLSGHQIMSTIHARSAAAVVTRLASEEIALSREIMGLRGFLSALVYQRLAPINCPECALPATGNIPQDRLDLIWELFRIRPDGIKVVNPAGCPHCEGRGIKGQTVLAEVIVPDETILAHIRDGRDAMAESAWRHTRIAAFDHPDMQGKTAFEHGLYKMAIGLIDPETLEDAFEPFEMYQPAAKRME